MECSGLIKTKGNFLHIIGDAASIRQLLVYSNWKGGGGLNIVFYLYFCCSCGCVTGQNGISLFVCVFLFLLGSFILILSLKKFFAMLVVYLCVCRLVLVLDSETANRLEVVSSLNPTGGPSLLSSLNSCQTAAGKRLLRSNLLEPMTDVEAIRQRLDAVEELTSRPTDLHQPIKVRIRRVTN